MKAPWQFISWLFFLILKQGNIWPVFIVWISGGEGGKPSLGLAGVECGKLIVSLFLFFSQTHTLSFLYDSLTGVDRVWGGGGCRTSTIYIRERIVNVWQGWGECSARGCPSSLAFFFPSVRSPTTVSVNCVNHCNKVAFGFRQDNMTTMWPFWTGPPLTLTPGFKQSTAGHNACVRACARERERERERER